jgi:tetratricopeptide (TPR) repeat protein
MNTIRELLNQISNPNLSTSERVWLRCELAKQFERTGNYEAARGAMDDLWRGIGEYPNLKLLDERTSAEVLLRVGVLTGWIGSIRLIKGSQRVARSLLGESIAIFASLSHLKKMAEAQIEVALCYMREGSLNSARRLYAEALAQLDDRDGDLKALAILRSALVELLANRLSDSLNILKSGADLFEASTNHVLRGAFHNNLARVLRNLGADANRPEYMEQALTEYKASISHYEQTEHVRCQAGAQNNIALLFLQLERFAEAHEHLDHAQTLLTRLGDSTLASVEETRARVLLAEGAVSKAEQCVTAAITIFEKGDEFSKLAEALTTHGVALSRLGRFDQARTSFERAVSSAEEVGDLPKAGLAALAFIEELAEQLSDDELCSLFERARHSLKDSQDPVSLNRLSECAWRILSIIHTTHPDWTTFSLSDTLRRHEGRFIKMALEDAGGSVTKAAGLLGLPGHQSLNFILRRRHQELLNLRTPIKPRRHSTLKLITPKRKVAGNAK